MFANHIYHDSQRDDERCIDALCYFDGVAVAEERELATDLRHQVAVVVADGEVPVPDVAPHMEVHAAVGLNLEAFSEKAELLVHTGREHAEAVNFIMGHE